MAITNLSTQYISASFQNLAQVSSSGDLYNGAGTQVTSLNVNSTYATTAGSAAAITGIDITSLATTGSNIFKDNQTIQGNVVITGNLTANQYIVSSSVYVVTQSFSSGSTIFGNDSLDTHQFTGSIQVQGSITGSLLGTSSNAALLNSQAASYYTNASNINAGTISDSYLPATISSDITGNAATATSASYALTASYAANAGGTSISASYAATASVCTGYAQGSYSAYSIGSNSNLTLTPLLGNTATGFITPMTDSGGQFTYNLSTNRLEVVDIGATSITGSLLGNATTATSSSYAINASSASLAGLAAHSNSAISASYALTASYALNGGGGSALIVADEGSTLTSAAASLNFVGNAVVATTIGNAVTVTIATGSGAGGATSPGGSSGQVQFNNGGSFDGAAGLVVDSSGNVTALNTRVMTPDQHDVHVINYNLEEGLTWTNPGTLGYALNGTKIVLGPVDSINPKAGMVYGYEASSTKWSMARCDRNLMTGSLALVLADQAGSGLIEAYLPGTLAVIRTNAPTWNAGPSAYTPGSVLYCDHSGNVLPTPTTTSGEHVRVIGHVYQNWTDGSDTYATFLFDPDGLWVTL